MNSESKTNLLVVAVFLLAIIGFGLLQLFTYVVPMTEKTTGTYYLFTLAIIVLGLLIPYWMLKLVSKAAHEHNPEEREMHLDDIPKDKEQLADYQDKAL